MPMSTTPFGGALAAFPGMFADTPVQYSAQAIPITGALTYLQADTLIYTCLPPTEGWYAFRYRNWFADYQVALPQSALQILNSDDCFEATTNKSYLVAIMPTAPHIASNRQVRNFEIASMRQHLREMSLESVFWMIRSLAMSGLPDGITWMLGMHEPFVVDGVPHRLNYSKVPRSGERSQRDDFPSVTTCVTRPDTLLTAYGALGFLSE